MRTPPTRPGALDLDTLYLATLHLDALVRRVTPSSLHAPTPCAPWTVGDLIAHVRAGHADAVQRLAGLGPRRDGVPAARRHRGDELDAYLTTSAELRHAFDRPGAVELRVPDPLNPEEPLPLIGLRIAEAVVHAWDLATALGEDTTLPEPLVRAGLDVYEALADRMRSVGLYGDGPVAAPEATTVQQWLLHLTGRRP
jgi:uncharacterized protein (TIGR03086 family)